MTHPVTSRHDEVHGRSAVDTGKLFVSVAVVLFLLCSVGTRVSAQIAVDTCLEAQKGLRPRIEVMPFLERGDTCRMTSARECYGEVCGLQSANYSLPDALYRLRLNEGNRVAFELQEGDDLADHVLVLVKECEETSPRTELKPCGDTNCLAASLDFIGNEDETIPATSYAPGFYYLIVDSADDAFCGPYTLSVTGSNPVPELRLSLTAEPVPVVAGTELTYRVSLSNVGTLNASETRVEVSLPGDVRLPARLPPNVVLVDGKVHFVFGVLPVGETRQAELSVVVNPAARGVLTAGARAEALEGELPQPVSVTTEIRAETDLRIVKNSQPDPVIAGCGMTYTLNVFNSGPSTATSVVLVDDLPETAVPFAAPVVAGCSPSPGCPLSSQAACELIAPGRLKCELGSLGPGGGTGDLCLPVRVKSSATGELRNRAQVSNAPDEEDRNPRDNVTVETTAVVREADLAIDKRTSTGREVLDGRTLTYELEITNQGPSDSSGATIRDILPVGASFQSSREGCGLKDDAVVCRVAPVAGGRESVTYEVVVDPSDAEQTFQNRAQVIGDDEDPLNGNNRDSVGVEIVADLRAERLSLEPAMVPAGGNLIVRFEAVNSGPSDSPEGSVTVTLTAPLELEFIASPDGCRPVAADAAGDFAVECPFATIEASAGHELRFVARVPLTADVDDTIGARAMLAGSGGKDPVADNDAVEATPVTVVEAAELVVDLFADEVVTVGGRLRYEVAVANRGPSIARGGVLCSCRSSALSAGTFQGCAGPSFDSATCPGEEFCAGVALSCALPDLLPGQERALSLEVRAPFFPLEVSNEVVVTAANSATDRAEVATTVAASDEVVLFVSVADAVDPVIAGDPLRYTVMVEHRGPASRTVSPTVEIRLPEEVVLSDAPRCYEESGLLTCDLDEMGLDASELVEITVMTARDSTRALALDVLVDAAARITGDLSETTRVLAAPDLILPFFEIEKTASGLATLFAVRNLGAAVLDLDYFSPQADLLYSEQSRDLDKREVHTVNLRDVEELFGDDQNLATGFVTIGEPGDMPRRRRLAGDFLWIDPRGRSASGLRIVSTDSAQVPRRFCRRWGARVSNGDGFDGRTDFVLWLPQDPVPDEPLVGRVYTESGEFVHTVEVPIVDRASKWSSEGLLVSTGVIEWELPEGTVGNLSAVHRSDGLSAVALQGVCLDPQLGGWQPGCSASQVIPFFEAASEGGGASTLLAVRNESGEQTAVRFRYFKPAERSPVFEEQCTLDAKAVRTVDLSVLGEIDDEWCESIGDPEGLDSGYVQVEIDPAACERDVFLSGDYVRVLADDQKAGETLVNADPSNQPPDLCSRWISRLIHGGGFRGSTDFIFYVPDGLGGSTLIGTVFDEAGLRVADIRVARDDVSFVVGSGEEEFEAARDDTSANGLFGSIEWSFPDQRQGHLSTIYRVGEQAVLVRGICVEP